MKGCEMKNFLEKAQLYAIILGAIGFIMGIVNAVKGRTEFILPSFALFGVGALAVVIPAAISKYSDQKANRNPHLQQPVITNIPAEKPVTVLGIVVLLERPLRFANDEDALIKSIFDQQRLELKRAIAPAAQVKMIVAGASLDDDAYIYGICRSTFDNLDSYADNDEFLSRVATGSFVASDGNRGKHFAFLNRRI